MLTRTIILFVLLGSTVYGQDNSSIPESEVRSASLHYPGKNLLKAKYQYYFDFWSQQEVFHGRYSRWNKSGVLVYDAAYTAGLLSGPIFHFSDKGNIQKEEMWKDGKLHGKTKLYDRKGRQRVEIAYQHGIREGLEKHYFPSGELKSVTTWLNGIKEGPFLQYDRQGKLKSQFLFQRGKRQKVSRQKTPHSSGSRPATH